MNPHMNTYLVFRNNHTFINDVVIHKVYVCKLYKYIWVLIITPCL